MMGTLGAYMQWVHVFHAELFAFCACTAHFDALTYNASIQLTVYISDTFSKSIECTELHAIAPHRAWAAKECTTSKHDAIRTMGTQRISTSRASLQGSMHHTNSLPVICQGEESKCNIM
jgi:hypothetical protein